MKLTDIVVSLPLAKKLKRLKLDYPESLYYWDSHATDKVTGKYGITSDGEYKAYTSAELWEIIPDSMFLDDKECHFGITKTPYWYECGYREIIYRYPYTRLTLGKTEADALAEMLIWLSGVRK